LACAKFSALFTNEKICIGDRAGIFSQTERKCAPYKKHGRGIMVCLSSCS